MDAYPRLCIHLDRIRENAARVAERCRAHGIAVCAVTKGISADLNAARAMLEGGCDAFADSRIRNLIRLEEAFPAVDRFLLRIPMRSELEAVVRTASCSTVSMIEAVEALEAECAAQGKTHRALLMFDLGDRREGILEEEMEAFVRAFKRCPRVRLHGVGANFACFAGALPSAGALERLASARSFMEDGLGHAVPVCSGGETSSLKLLEEGTLPRDVNHLRVGEAILLGGDVAWQRAIPWLRQDTVELEAQVIEAREKPSRPEGPIGPDAFGRVQTFEDRGRRLRAILGIGRQDLPVEGLRPLDEGVEVLGGSSDHTLLDVGERPAVTRWGDVLRFGVDYGAMLSLSTSPYVARACFEDGREVRAVPRGGRSGSAPEACCPFGPP